MRGEGKTKESKQEVQDGTKLPQGEAEEEGKKKLHKISPFYMMRLWNNLREKIK